MNGLRMEVGMDTDVGRSPASQGRAGTPSEPGKAGIPNAKWHWWAGRDEEWLTVGPCNAREDAIAEAVCEFGEGEGDFVILEGVMHEISLSASSIIDDAYNRWADDSDLFSSESDAPEPCGSKEEQKAAESELQALLDAWVAKWRHTLPTPDMFASTRSLETIRNTVDPDMLPGGHDNPKEAA
jgi:hypothetical protein